MKTKANKRLIQIAAIVYSMAAFAYIVYSQETQTGICGYMAALQLKWFDEASRKITMIAAISLFALPLLAALPALLEVKIPRVQDKIIYLPVTYPSLPRSWKMVFVITAIPLVATAALTAALQLAAIQDQKETIYKVDLDQRPAAVPGTAKFVELSGVLQREFVSGLESGSATDAYAPLTGSAWTADLPVKYFVHHAVYGEKPVLPSFSRRTGRDSITGKIGGTLPVFAKNEYTSKGLKIEPAYLIVNWMEFSGERVPASTDHLIVLMVGGTATLLTFCIAAVMRIKPGADTIAEASIRREWVDKGRTLCFPSPDGEEIRFRLSKQTPSGEPLRFAGKGYHGGDLYLHLRFDASSSYLFMW